MPGKVYWDANVILNYINEDATHKPTLGAFLEDGENGLVELVTSTLSLAEVAFAAAEKDAKTLDPEVEARIDKLWYPIGPIRLIEFHRLIGIEARGLLRIAVATGQHLRPPDAIHLATAKYHGCTEFQTYNNTKLVHFSAEIGCPVNQPVHPKPKLI